MKRLMFAAAAVAAFEVTAVETWEVDTVAKLTNAVAQAAKNDTILIKASGSPYDLGSVACMHRVAHLYSGKKTAYNLKGETGDPTDVVLVGTTNRILYIYDANARTISGITFRNGDCTQNTKHTTPIPPATNDSPEEPYDGKDGGAVCLRGDKCTNIVFTNCVFAGNKATDAGGAIGNYYAQNSTRYAGTFIDCVFTNNTSASYGGAMRSASVVRGCTFVDNVAGGRGGALFNPFLVERSTFIGNGTTSTGGAISWASSTGAPTFVVTGCTFRVNQASSGGAIDGSCGDAGVYGCTFEGNSATDSGGAVYLMDDMRECTFVTNSALYGGAIRNCRDTGSTYLIQGVASSSGGGVAAYESDLTGIHCTGQGLGKRSALYSCTVRDSCFDGSYVTNGVICSYSTFDRCRFTNITNPVPKETGAFLFGFTTSATNCLIAGCQLYSIPYNSKAPMGIYNCTIVSNAFSSWGAGGSSKAEAVMKNTFLYGNVCGSHVTDFASRLDESFARIDNSIFHMSSDLAIEGENNINYRLISGFDPRFVGAEADPENPYALKRHSPAIGKGAVEDWMSGATDLRGGSFARLRDGKVDVGCYQCWLDPSGLLLLFW